MLKARKLLGCTFAIWNISFKKWFKFNYNIEGRYVLLGGDTGSYPNICFFKYLRIRQHFPHYVFSDHTSFSVSQGRQRGRRPCRTQMGQRVCSPSSSVQRGHERETLSWPGGGIAGGMHVRGRNGYCPAICLQVRDVETETQKEEVLILPLGPNIRTKWRRKW